MGADPSGARLPVSAEWGPPSPHPLHKISAEMPDPWEQELLLTGGYSLTHALPKGDSRGAAP